MVRAPVTATDQGQGALICIPTYNEAENLPLIVAAVREQVPQAQILVVDDNSPDGTGALADGLATEHPGVVHVLHRTAKEGLGRAYMAAFEWAMARDYAFIFEFDADFSHNPAYLPPFIATLRSGEADVLVGSRRVAGGGVENWSASRRFISWGGSMYARVILGVSVKDLTGGFNGFRREVVEYLLGSDVDATGYAFQIELKYRALKAGFCVVERPIIFPDRTRGESKMSSDIFKEAMVRVWKLRFGEVAPK
jgi:dolichol-phosphate mannosyltransferase